MPVSALAFSANSKGDHDHAQGRPTDLLLLHCNCGSGFSACIACDKRAYLERVLAICMQKEHLERAVGANLHMFMHSAPFHCLHFPQQKKKTL